MNDREMIELWDIMSAYIPDKMKEQAANQFMEFVVNYDFSPKEVRAIAAYDDYLGEAYKELQDEDDDVSPIDEEEY